MRHGLFFFLIASWLSASPLSAQDALPDDYLQFVLRIQDGELTGSSEYLEGFRVSMSIPAELPEHWLSTTDSEAFISLVRDREVAGTLTYPTGKQTRIEYEIVRHGDAEGVYMKTTLGYFLWERLQVRNGQVAFVINWWYCPPAREADLRILEMAGRLLADSLHWHKRDDRRCDDDRESDRWSVFCALKHASLEITGECNHHNTAMQTVRFVIDDLIPEHGFAHTLMDYNNAPATKHGDVLRVLEIARERIATELDNSEE